MERGPAEIDGTLVSWLRAPCEDPPVLYVHGVPDSAAMWTPFLERTGGIAVDLPGFGESGKSASGRTRSRATPRSCPPSSITSASTACASWPTTGERSRSRSGRGSSGWWRSTCCRTLPGHRWPWVARMWRTPVVGELAMGFTNRFLLRRLGGLSADHADEVLRYFDHGTQRAILKLYRSARENLVALDAITAPALVLWGERDRYLGPEWAGRIAGALGGETRVEIVPEAGHWPWLDRPEILQIVQDFAADCHPADTNRSPFGDWLNSSPKCAVARL